MCQSQATGPRISWSLSGSRYTSRFHTRGGGRNGARERYVDFIFLVHVDSLNFSQTSNFRIFQTERSLQMTILNFKRVENAAGKGEIAHCEQFLLFPQCFQKTCRCTTAMEKKKKKTVLVQERVKPLPHNRKYRLHLNCKQVVSKNVMWESS